MRLEGVDLFHLICFKGKDSFSEDVSNGKGILSLGFQIDDPGDQHYALFLMFTKNLL